MLLAAGCWLQDHPFQISVGAFAGLRVRFSERHNDDVEEAIVFGT